MPLYTELTLGGATENVCVNIETRVADRETHNNPGKWAFLHFTLTSQSNATLTITANPAPPPTTDTTVGVRDRADPDVFMFNQGVFVGSSRSGDDDQEIYDMGSLSAGTYALEFHDWRHIDTERASDYPERVCFDFTLN